MTAINVIQQADAVHLVTDGLVKDGHRGAINVSKVWTLPHIGAAISISGGDRSLVLLQRLGYEAMLACSRPEYLFTQLVDLVRECQRKYAGTVPDPKGGDAPDHFLVVAAAFIEKPCQINGRDIARGPLVGMVASHATAMLPAYSLLLEPQAVGRVFLYPDVAPIPAQIAVLFQAQNVTIEDVAAKMIEAQRVRISVDYPHAIGGHAMVTSINHEATVTKIVRRWQTHLIEAGGYADDDELLH